MNDWKQEFDQKFTPNSIYPEEVKQWIKERFIPKSDILSAIREEKDDGSWYDCTHAVNEFKSHLRTSLHLEEK